MKTTYLSLFFLFQISFVFCQNSTVVYGKIVDESLHTALEDVIIATNNDSETKKSSPDGYFRFEEIEVGEITFSFHHKGYKNKDISVIVAKGQQINLGIITLESEMDFEQEPQTIAISDMNLSDDNGSSENSFDILQSSKNAFQRTVAYNWHSVRFRMRGLDSRYATVAINGISMNKLYDSRPQWNNWSGLNDVLRNQEFSSGNAPSDYNFGGVLGTQTIHISPSDYNKGIRFSSSGANTMFKYRATLTYTSGNLPKGWSFVVSAGFRFADEGYFDGTPYNAKSFFGSVEKKLGKQHSICLSGFYVPISQGRTSTNTDEVTQLMGERYNAYWGFQNGRKRNARMKTVEEPILMLNHEFHIDEKTKLMSNVMYQWGEIGNSNIDYQNANSPDPTYYRKLPSYYTSLYENDKGEFSGAFVPDYLNAEKSKALFLSQPQIDWKSIYLANQSPILDPKGEIIGYSGAKSNYVLFENRSDDKTIAGSTILTSKIAEKVSLTAGVSIRNTTSHNYKKVLDLLGGLYFTDSNTFYKGNQSQSDLNNPNRQLYVGDAYGYNYILNGNYFEAFTQFKITNDKVDYFLAQRFSTADYQREGLYKNGIYETNSFGKSEQIVFENFGFKGGVTVRLSGNESFVINGSYTTKAPDLKAVFPNARLNNTFLDGLSSETISSLEASHTFNSFKLKSYIATYFNLIKNTSQNSYLYAEGIYNNGAGYDNTNGYIIQNVTGLDKRNLGVELGLEYQVLPNIKGLLAANFGEYVYTTNPDVRVIDDAKASTENTSPISDFGKAILKNYKQSGTPQQAYSFGLEYRNANKWQISSNINYLTANYIDVSPITRTATFFINPASGFPFPEATAERAKTILKQEQLPAILLLNLSINKPWRLFNYDIRSTVTITNLLDDAYKINGYEQGRNANYRQRNQDLSSGTPSFGNKYLYGYGRTFLINISILL